jgi:hypothetical protein
VSAILTEWWQILKQKLEPDTEQQRVDADYLASETVQYEWITVKADAGRVRCDICGRLMDIQKMPDLMEHVGSHNEQGAAEVDPTQTPDRPAVLSVEKHELENGDVQEPWEI